MLKNQDGQKAKKRVATKNMKKKKKKGDITITVFAPTY